jgi:diacylglycerol kinase (ATP)
MRGAQLETRELIQRSLEDHVRERDCRIERVADGIDQPAITAEPTRELGCSLRVEENQHPKLFGFRPERMKLRISKLVFCNRCAHRRSAQPELFDGVLQLLRGKLRKLECHGCKSDKPVRVGSAIFRKSLVLDGHHSLGGGAVRPIPGWIDAQRFDVDPLFVHDGQTLCADFVDAASEAHIAIGDTQQVLGLRNNAVCVNVDRLDPSTAHAHLAPPAARGSRGASATHLRAGRRENASMTTCKLHAPTVHAAEARDTRERGRPVVPARGLRLAQPVSVIRPEAYRGSRHWRDEETRAQSIEHSIGESRALAQVKPELVSRPLAKLWSKRRALLIVNSKSGPNRDSLLQTRELVEMLGAFRIRAEVRVKLRKSQVRKDVRAAARSERYDLIIAAGGDGTVEAVAAGLVGSQVALGIIPLGTFNNVASSLGIPPGIREACALIGCGSPRRVDAGLMIAKYMKKPRVFLEVSTVGVGATVGVLGQHLEKGRWEAAAASIPGVAEMALTPTHVKLDEGSPHAFNTLLVTVSNAPRAGAGLKLAPNALMDDGMLDVRVYRNLDQPGLVASLLPVVLDRSVGVDSDQIWQARAACIEIHTAHPMPVSIESKLVGVTPARFTSMPGALSVIVGNTEALVDPVAPALVRASGLAAGALAPTPPPPVGLAAPVGMAEPGLATRAVQAVVPAAGRTVEALSSARSLALPLATAALGLAAGVLLPAKRKSAKKRGR